MTSPQNTVNIAPDAVVPPAQMNVTQQTPPEQPETQQQIDWKRFKAQREVERKQKEEAEKVAAQKTAEAEALKAAMEAILNKPQQPQQSQDQYDSSDDSEDTRINKAVEAAIAKRDAAIASERAINDAQNLPTKLSSTYSDFNQVCSTENLDYLQFHYPEVAYAFKQSPDSFDKWSNVYQAVKRFVPNTDTSKDRKKMETNLSKPQSISSPQSSTSQMSAGPNILSEERRAENYKRMLREMGKGGIG